MQWNGGTSFQDIYLKWQMFHKVFIWVFEFPTPNEDNLELEITYDLKIVAVNLEFSVP